MWKRPEVYGTMTYVSSSDFVVSYLVVGCNIDCNRNEQISCLDRRNSVFQEYNFHLIYILSIVSSFDGLVVSMLASGTGVRGFKPGRSRRIFRVKKSSAYLPSEGK
jgi:hypothetical protein